MDYKDALNDLRAQIFAEPAPKEKPKTSGIIPVRTQQPALQPSQGVNRSVEWLRQIKSAAEEQRKSLEVKKAKVEEVAASFTPEQTAPIAAVTTPEGRQETFIKRRGDLPSSYAPRPSNATNFEEAINATESGGSYDTLFSHSQRDGGAFSGVKVSEMTIGDLVEFAKGDYAKWTKDKLGYVATPMGKYQFVGSTLASTAKEMGLPPDTVFDQQTQDAMFNYKLNQRLASSDTLSGKMANVRSEWAGFKNIPDDVLARIITEHEAT